MTNASAAAALPAAPIPAAIDPAFAIHQAAQRLLPHLERGQRVDAASLRAAMEAAFDASDASGAWGWKTAYDACEAASVLFLRKYGKALLRKAGSPAAALPMLARVTGLLPTHTRRSTESEAFQQFSTPIPLGLIATTAAFGRHRPSLRLRRACWWIAGAKRVGRDPRWPFGASLPRHRCHTFRRCADR